LRRVIGENAVLEVASVVPHVVSEPNLEIQHRLLNDVVSNTSHVIEPVMEPVVRLVPVADPEALMYDSV